MMEKTNKKGFIQIPLLIGIIVSIIVVAGTGFGVVSYQQKKLDFLTNSVTEIPKEERKLIDKENEELLIREKELEDRIIEMESLKEENDTAIEIEKLKEELKRLKESSNRQVQIQPVVPQKSLLTNNEIIQKVKPSVVFVQTKTGNGSGFIIDSIGHILTNAHVVRGHNYATVKLTDGNNYPATVIGRDEMVDLAILKINKINLPYLILGNSEENILKQGDDVFTFGFPFGIEGDVSFKDGTLSRRLGDYLEISAEIHPGNSGGPLINRLGEVIGVNTFGIGRGNSGVIKFAIPVNTAKNYIPALKAGRNIALNDSSLSSPSLNNTKTSTVKIERLRDSFEIKVYNEGPNKIRIEYFIFVDWDGKERLTNDDYFTHENSNFHYRFPWDLSNTRLKILKGVELSPDESINVYLSGIGRHWKSLKYSPESIIDIETGRSVFFDSINF